MLCFVCMRNYLYVYLFYSMVVRLGCLTPLVCQPLRVSSVKLDVEFFACQNTTLATQFV